MSVVIWFVDGASKRKRRGCGCLASIALILLIAAILWIVSGNAEKFLHDVTKDSGAPPPASKPEGGMRETLP